MTAADLPLTPEEPVVVPGGPGGYDWMEVDAPLHRLYAAHKGTHTLAALDLKTGKILASPKTGEAQGIAIDAADNKVFVGNAEEQSITVLDRKTLSPTATIKVPGPVDAMAYDPKRHRVYADHDDGTEAWVIDAKTDRVVGAVTLPGIPEYIAYDARTDRLYQNVKDTNSLAVIDPATNKVIANWSTMPAAGPHGLALDDKARRLYSAGKGFVSVIDLASGKIVETVPIARGSVDQIAYDAKRQRLYCATAGAISVVMPTASGGKLLANVPQAKGAHTLAVDPETGAVWISYSDGKESYLQKFLIKD